MFKHILIPTDGSPVSAKAVKAGIGLAKQTGAKVTGYYALEPVPVRLYGEGYVADRQMVAEFERRARQRKEAGRRHRTRRGQGWRAVRYAGRDGAHAVREDHRSGEEAQVRPHHLMASHGYRGLMRLTLGSVTDKVIQLSKTPVLVYR